ncbi:helix-turn-helix domain-containing protein [Microbacteriaceae bacterium K1510]|nr:helix-turn-helix domain-containing protein [Microbacteriaceae bacterium K1510]
MINEMQCRSARAWLGLSQGDLAALSKVSARMIAHFEAGNRVPMIVRSEIFGHASKNVASSFCLKARRVWGFAFGKNEHNNTAFFQSMCAIVTEIVEVRLQLVIAASHHQPQAQQWLGHIIRRGYILKARISPHARFHSRFGGPYQRRDALSETEEFRCAAISKVSPLVRFSLLSSLQKPQRRQGERSSCAPLKRQ